MVKNLRPSRLKTCPRIRCSTEGRSSCTRPPCQVRCGYAAKRGKFSWLPSTKSVVKAFMIEKREAMENLEEICRIPGVDMVQFGPSDYSMSMGWNRNEHQEELEQVQRTMIETALACGVRPRVEISTVEEAETYKALGVKDFSILDQMAILMRSWTGECAQVRRVARDED